MVEAAKNVDLDKKTANFGLLRMCFYAVRNLNHCQGNLVDGMVHLAKV
jgi:hypothetical protein